MAEINDLDLGQVFNFLVEIQAMGDLMLNLSLESNLDSKTLPAIGARLDDLAKGSLELLGFGEDEE